MSFGRFLALFFLHPTKQTKKSTAGSFDFTCLTPHAAAESTFKYLEYHCFECQKQQVERLEELVHACLPACLPV